MTNVTMIEELKRKIEDKRNHLNYLISTNVDESELLKHSMELDKLIGEYYKHKDNIKKN